MGIAQRLPAPENGQVLLVDGTASGMHRVLERAGYCVVGCGSGDEALAALVNQSFDVIIADIQMAGTGGLELLRAVRDRELDLPVVLVTSDPCIQSASKAVEYGAFRYLIKPVPTEELCRVVGRAASLGQLSRSRQESLIEVGSGKFEVGTRIGLSTLLDRALSSLWLAYQPIVRALDSNVFAYEALLRSDEALLPDAPAVIDAAERTESLHDLGRAVRGRIITDARRSVRGPLFFVNLHAEELRDPTLYLSDSTFSKLAPRIVLEITERMSLDYLPDVADRIARLRALGFQIALDDLGAGYAGLASFARLEPEYVKLDMSLVRNVDQNPTQQKIIRSMVHLCHDLGRLIIAEGVERIEERNTLIDLNVDLLQGHLFAKPGKPFPAVAPTRHRS